MLIEVFSYGTEGNSANEVTSSCSLGSRAHLRALEALEF